MYMLNSKRKRLVNLLEMLVKRENGDPEMVAENERRETSYGDITLLREDSQENRDIKMLHDMGFIRSEHIADPSSHFSMAGIFAYTITEDGREFLAKQRGASAARSPDEKKPPTAPVHHPWGWSNEWPTLLSDEYEFLSEQQAASGAWSLDEKKPPTAFISYSWDDESHKNWVKELATRLRKDRIDVKLDQWEVFPGDSITEFIETGIRESDFVIIICTPRYKERSDNRVGGVGYEESMITGEVFTNPSNRNKFIPVLRSGEWADAAPSRLTGIDRVDLSGSAYSEREYARLRDVLLGQTETAPPIGGGL